MTELEFIEEIAEGNLTKMILLNIQKVFVIK